MSDIDQRVVFSRNLNRMLEITGKSQLEVANAIGVIPSTFNTWCTGVAFPRMGKVQKLADYFGIEKSALIDEKPSSEDQGSLFADAFADKDLREALPTYLRLPQEKKKHVINTIYLLDDEP